MDRLRVGIIGSTGQGGYGHQLDHAFIGHEATTIVAVADPDPTGLDDAIGRTGAPRGYQDFATMLRTEEPDIAVVCPRQTNLHADIVKEALRAGAHVYCEKPLAVDLAEADSMLALARSVERKLAVALPFAHEPRAAQLSEMIGSGSIGRVLSLRGTTKCDHRGGGQDWAILGPHLFDLARRILGNPSRCHGQVSAGGRPIAKDDVVAGDEGIGWVAGDTIIAQYDFDEGRIAQIESWKLGIADRARQPYRLDIHGDRGILSIRAPYADHSLWYHDGPFTFPGDDAWVRVTTEPMASYGAYHRRAADDFVDAIRDDREPLVSGQDGVWALEMMLAPYWSHIADGPVALPLGDRRSPLDVLMATQQRPNR